MAHLATVGAGGRPHLVPVAFVLQDETLYFAVDAKPKRTTDLKRLRNITANPAVSMLFDHYEEDWGKLWWVRVDGAAEVVESERAVGALAAKYPQYRAERPAGPLIAIAPERWRSWVASEP